MRAAYYARWSLGKWGEEEGCRIGWNSVYITPLVLLSHHNHEMPIQHNMHTAFSAQASWNLHVHGWGQMGTNFVLAPPKWEYDSFDTHINEISTDLVVQWSDLSMKIKIWLLHHQMHSDCHDISINNITLLMRRCKDNVWSCLPSA